MKKPFKYTSDLGDKILRNLANSEETINKKNEIVKNLIIQRVSNSVCDIATCEKSAGASIFYDPCKDCADNPQTDC